MDNGLLLAGVLVVALIFFLTKIPRRESTMYVSRPYPIFNPIWNAPVGWARPMRRWGPHGWRPRRHHRRHHHHL